MSSIEPNDAGGKVDGSEEVAGGLVIAGCDGAELLEPGEEVLNQVPFLLEVAVEVARLLAGRLWRDDRGFAGFAQRLDDPLVSIERLVAEVASMRVAEVLDRARRDPDGLKCRASMGSVTA